MNKSLIQRFYIVFKYVIFLSVVFEVFEGKFITIVNLYDVSQKIFKWFFEVLKSRSQIVIMFFNSNLQYEEKQFYKIVIEKIKRKIFDKTFMNLNDFFDSIITMSIDVVHDNDVLLNWIKIAIRQQFNNQSLNKIIDFEKTFFIFNTW